MSNDNTPANPDIIAAMNKIYTACNKIGLGDYQMVYALLEVAFEFGDIESIQNALENVVTRRATITGER